MKTSKMYKFAVISLILVSIFSTSIYAAEGDTLYDMGYEDGGEIGQINAKARALDTYNKDIISGWDIIEKKADLITKYNLDKLDTEYKNGFYIGYRDMFKETYVDSYYDLVVQGVKDIEEGNEMEDKDYYDDGMLQAEKYAVELAIINSEKDVEKAYTRDYNRALPLKQDLVNKYSLQNENTNYVDGFVDGFKKVYQEKYDKAYIEFSTKKSGEQISEYSLNIEGGSIYSADKALMLEIPKGTVYLSKKIYIKTLNNMQDIKTTNKEIISGIYDIYAESNMKTYNNMLIKFKYYGQENVGIYRVTKDNQLEYIPTALVNGYLNAYIRKGIFEREKIVVCLDSQIPRDILGHWGKQELVTFFKRGIISPNEYNNVAPDGFMTREQFVYMVDRVFKLENNEILNVIPKVTLDMFYDKGQVSEYTKASMERLLTLKFISGYGNNTLMPNKLITYEEVEIILRRVTLDSTLNWSTVQQSLMIDKGILPNLASKSDRAVKSEVIYLLNKYLD
ncbi:MAG TPA: hypothetical protein DEP72_02090 [Clostridiales bacterium]|nr:MAG: hypothetical protein A2Y18_00280 [Clostridiales bacterium GWD2_32_19]HCC06946.1 hypothetical protein [Clostridiales bacterium]